MKKTVISPVILCRFKSPSLSVNKNLVKITNSHYYYTTLSAEYKQNIENNDLKQFSLQILEQAGHRNISKIFNDKCIFSSIIARLLLFP